MRITKRKVFMAWQFEKEEQWINEMSKKGYQLVDVGFLKYVFEKAPTRYIYRLQMLDHDTSGNKRDDYIAFVEDTGAEYVGSQFQWVYFRKHDDGKGFDLFSDIDSRIKHLRQNLWIFGLLGGANFLIGLANIHNPFYVSYLRFANLFIGVLLLYAFYRIYKMVQNLLKERTFHE